MLRAAAVLVPTAIAAALLAACGSSGPETTGQPTNNASGSTASTAPEPTAAGLPFHYQALGESSSPTFRVSTAGLYTVAYSLKGDAQTPGCNVTLAMTADDGTARQVVPGVVLQPTDSKQGSVQIQLTPSSWRFQEGGGCSWEVTVSAAS